MKKAFLFLLFLLLVSGFFYGYEKRGRTVEINGVKFRAETAATKKEREKGLSLRKNLCADCAMLFVFDNPGRHLFWMKDMQFNLDIIWISGDKIVFLALNVPFDFSQKINPGADADKVLEINGGLSEKYGFKVGDDVRVNPHTKGFISRILNLIDI